MQRVYNLRYMGLLAAELILPNEEGEYKRFPGLQSSKENIVIVAEYQDALVATISISLDGPNGISADSYFPEEMQEFRSEGEKIASVWGFVIEEEHRSIRLLCDLLSYTANVLIEHEVKHAFFTFRKRHVHIYQRFIELKKIAWKNYSIDNKAAPKDMCLMIGDPAAVAAILEQRS